MKNQGKTFSILCKLVALIFACGAGITSIVNDALTQNRAFAIVIITIVIANLALPVDISKIIVNAKKVL